MNTSAIATANAHAAARLESQVCLSENTRLGSVMRVAACCTRSTSISSRPAFSENVSVNGPN